MTTFFVHGPAGSLRTLDDLGDPLVWSTSSGGQVRAVQMSRYTEIQFRDGVQGVRPGDFVAETGGGDLIVVPREQWTLTLAYEPVPEAEGDLPPPSPPAPPAPALSPFDIPAKWRLDKFRLSELKQLCRDAGIPREGNRRDLIVKLARFRAGREP
jgi:hypothetical protein